MTTSHIFVSYSSTAEVHSDQSVAMRLIDDLRAAGAEVVVDDESISSDSFVQTLNTELPTCQWLILLQTSAALHSPKIQMTVNTALNLVAQQRMQGVLRVIIEPSAPSEVPPTWAALNTFDAYQYYSRDVAKLLLTTGLVQSTDADDTPSLAPPLPQALAIDDAPVNLSSSPFGIGKRKRNILIIGLPALMILLTLGSLISILLQSNSSHTSAGSSMVTGSVFFTSSGVVNINSSQGLNDEIEIDLSNVAAPTRGKSDYAWLLPDASQQGKTIPLLLSQLSVQHGTIHFKYVDAAHTNLLTIMSSFLITEEGANILPANPLLDTSTWMYYGEFSQVANPNDTTNHYSLLDHLRHLLAADPMLQKLSLQGGLNTWFLQNTRKVLEWATAAQGTSSTQTALMHRHFVRILDYLDGLSQLKKDVPPGNPLLTDPIITRVPLLTLDPAHQNPLGYIYDIDSHLHGLENSPGVTDQQNEFAQQTLTAMITVGNELEQVHQDAIKLVRMTDAQLAQPTTVPLLDDLVTHANNAYVGQIDPTTGIRQGGVTWIYDHIQLLAAFTVTRYIA